jgi:hypothetical protein
MNRRFLIKFKVPLRASQDPDSQTYWSTIGHATEAPGGAILCTITAIPVAWNGEFTLYEQERKGKP